MPFKYIFFMFFSSIAAYVPFLALYLERAGIPGTEIGIILAISPALRIIITPLWGMLADMKNWHRQIFALCSLGSALVAPFYIFSSTFWAFMAVQALFIALRAPLVSIANKLALEVQKQGSFDFGKARIFGSIGFASVAIIGGKIAETYGIKYLFIYITFALLTVALFSLKLPDSSDSSVTKLFSNLEEIYNQKTLIIFLISATLIRIAAIAPTSYLSILMDKLGAGESLTGYSWAITTAIEIPIFYFSSRYLKRFGLRKIIFTGFLMTIGQVILYNFAYHPFILLIAQFFRGFGFATFYIAGINFVDNLAPARVRTTCQTLLTTANIGISGFLANIIGGALYQNFGLYSIYRFSLIMALLGSSIFFFKILRKEKVS